MAKPVTLSNGRSWKTQSAAKAHFRGILNSHRDGERVLDPQAQSDLLALVERYDRDEPAASRKGGVGVDHFFRDRDKEHNGLTSCFYVMRTDGSSIDFSIYRAVEVASNI